MKNFVIKSFVVFFLVAGITACSKSTERQGVALFGERSGNALKAEADYSITERAYVCDSIVVFKPAETSNESLQGMKLEAGIVDGKLAWIEGRIDGVEKVFREEIVNLFGEPIKSVDGVEMFCKGDSYIFLLGKTFVYGDHEGAARGISNLLVLMLSCGSEEETKAFLNMRGNLSDEMVVNAWDFLVLMSFDDPTPDFIEATKEERRENQDKEVEVDEQGFAYAEAVGENELNELERKWRKIRCDGFEQAVRGEGSYLERNKLVRRFVDPDTGTTILYRPIKNDEVEICFDVTGEIRYGGNFVIPAMIEGKKVTRIAGGAFVFEENLETVVIPEGVTSLGFCAFGDSKTLRSVSLPKSLLEVGKGLLPDSVKTVYVAKGDCARIEKLLKDSRLLQSCKPNFVEND